MTHCPQVSSSLDTSKCRPDRLNQTQFQSYQAYLLRERKMRPLKCRYQLDDTPYPKASRRLSEIS